VLICLTEYIWVDYDIGWLRHRVPPTRHEPVHVVQMTPLEYDLKQASNTIVKQDTLIELVLCEEIGSGIPVVNRSTGHEPHLSQAIRDMTYTISTRPNH
jgi:hypothetical protein